MDNFVLPGKINVLIDGQFGSTGKGLVASYIGACEDVIVALSSSSPNAGHTFIHEGTTNIARHLPVAGITNRRAMIYLCAGSIIDPELLREEIEMYDVADRIAIHPRCAIVEEKDKRTERRELKRIASTCKGTGAALRRKIMRNATLAGDHPYLKKYTQPFDLMWIDSGCGCLLEISQGFDLSINSGYSYPYCTSREISVSQALADVPIHPSYLGNVCVVLRTYPIRVGGPSGPFWKDSRETTWEKLGVTPEKTTVTKRIRRVATFSWKQLENVMEQLRPTHVFLNFCNYCDEKKLENLLHGCWKRDVPLRWLGYGPSVEDVTEVCF